MIDPSMNGGRAFTSVVYAAPGLVYPAPLSEFAPFGAPTANFSTRTIDISDFADLGFGPAWPFANTAIPLNGFLRVPDGPGSFPLALFAHGNHEPSENSTRGYLYLCELLASHGVLAGTIDVNFLNGGNFGENDGRAIVHLEHIRQFQIWNATAGHPLCGKIDLSRVMIVGHSRGGEAVGHASAFNRLNAVQPDVGAPTVPLDGTAGLGPYHFDLKAVVAIAPTDRQYVPVTGPTLVVDNYVVIHGSRDGDVNNFPGYLTYDRSHRVDLANPLSPAAGYKALLWVFRANHNFFNSAWGQESSVPTLTRPEQESIARTFIGAVAQDTLLAQPGYRELLKDHRIAVREGWLPSSLHFVSQYSDPIRVYLQHFDESGPALAVSLPAVGTVTVTAPLVANKLLLNLGSSSHLFQQSNGARLAWTGNGSYKLAIAPGSFPMPSSPVLTLRIGQSSEPANPGGLNQDVTVILNDGKTSLSFPISTYGELLYPDTTPVGTAPKTIMQTVRIPLDALVPTGLNPASLQSVEVRTDRTATGIIYLNDIQITA